MQHDLTWGTFSLVMAGALLIYYPIVAICCYRQELGVFFKMRFSRPAVPEETAGGYKVIGPVHEDEAEMSLVNSQELDFAGSGEMREAANEKKVLLLGGLADFMHELKTLVRITIESDDTKENFLTLTGIIASKYPEVTGGSFNEPIARHLLEYDLPFTISQNELNEVIRKISINEA